MTNPVNFFKAKWRRPKHKGVSGNFSTIVIIVGVVVGSYLMTGGGYPEISPTYSENVVEGQPLLAQPKHTAVNAMSFRELLFKPLPTREPTPIPTFGTPGEPEPECANTALVFLVDDSYSMTEPGANNTTKLANVTNAIRVFADELPPATLFGLYTFSSPNGLEPQRRIPIQPISTARSEVGTQLSLIDPPGNAATHMRAGFTYVQKEIRAAQIANPTFRFSLIFISDGVPEQEGNPGPGCQEAYTLDNFCDKVNNNRNYDKRHDPTGTWYNAPDIPKELRDEKVDIYSIVIFNATDTQVFPNLEDLMIRISSGAGYYSKSVGGGNLDSIYNNVRQTACS